MKTSGRTLFLLVFALWQGGFMFYGTIVVPVGARVLESETEQGFITQEVTTWLNACGFAALIGWFGTLLTDRLSGEPIRSRLALWMSLLALLAGQVILHSRMDGLLDRATHSVIEPDRFYAHHRLYLIVSTSQWLVAIVLLALTLASWSRRDCASGSQSRMESRTNIHA